MALEDSHSFSSLSSLRISTAAESKNRKFYCFLRLVLKLCIKFTFLCFPVDYNVPKLEKTDVYDDEEESCDEYNSKQRINKISFSIKNILSDNFGTKISNDDDQIDSLKCGMHQTTSALLQQRNIFDYRAKVLNEDQNIGRSFLNTISTNFQEEIQHNQRNYNLTSLSTQPILLGQLQLTVDRSPSTLSIGSQQSIYNDTSIQSPESSNKFDSDDCQSETSSNREDDQKMWPAWIYCTRYSSRPSSGKFLIHYFL